MANCSSARRALAVEHRLCDLAQEPMDPSPASLIDVLAGYHYLVEEVGFAPPPPPPPNIILMGDSAGAGIAPSLARYLVDNVQRLSVFMKGLDLSPAHAMILLSSCLGLLHKRLEHIMTH